MTVLCRLCCLRCLNFRQVSLPPWLRPVRAARLVVKHPVMQHIPRVLLRRSSLQVVHGDRTGERGCVPQPCIGSVAVEVAHTPRGICVRVSVRIRVRVRVSGLGLRLASGLTWSQD